ncbi:hypothetical protein IM40_06350 [Candidatus Paracaedimonas acanthamoebae]|nr:hypothetical protein IM40_06350 [Candidatus Paracaedimonas acanthamoebae]
MIFLSILAFKTADIHADPILVASFGVFGSDIRKVGQPHGLVSAPFATPQPLMMLNSAQNTKLTKSLSN